MPNKAIQKLVKILKSDESEIRSWVFISVDKKGDITLRANEGATEFEVQSMQSAMSNLISKNTIERFKETLN